MLEAAQSVFATSGVDAPVRKITEEAGVGVGTLYRHFPLRSDLIAAVFRREIDVHADELWSAASSLCVSAHHVGPDHARRMVALLVDGLRYGARQASPSI